MQVWTFINCIQAQKHTHKLMPRKKLQKNPGSNVQILSYFNQFNVSSLTTYFIPLERKEKKKPLSRVNKISEAGQTC